MRYLNHISLTHIFSILTLCLAASACTDKNVWEMTGKIAGAPAKTQLIVEASENGRWFGIDTVFTDSEGHFTTSNPAPKRPAIYRLRLNDKMVYFPIDSLDHLNFSATFHDFDRDFVYEGTPEAELMKSTDKLIIEALSQKPASAIVNDSLLKRELARKILSNPSGIAAYYVVNKHIANRPLFNPEDNFDNRIIGAVANAYTNQHPNDPRTEYIRKIFLAGHHSAKVYKAETTPMFDINLYDTNGKSQSLKELAAKNKVVVLNFTSTNNEKYQDYNQALDGIYNKYKGKSFAIYQVTGSESEAAWRNAARNLPWIGVFLPEGADVTPLINYNVNYVPTTFIIVNGEILMRQTNPGELDKEIAKHI